MAASPPAPAKAGAYVDARSSMCVRRDALRKRVYIQRFVLVGVRIRNAAAARTGYRDILFPVLGLIRHRNGHCAVIELRDPQLFPGFRIERAETLVIGRADEYDAAGGCDRAAHVDAARVFLSFGKFIGDAQRHLPHDIAGVRIDRAELTPWRLLARPALFSEKLTLRVHLPVPEFRGDRITPHAGSIVRNARTVGPL